MKKFLKILLLVIGILVVLGACYFFLIKKLDEKTADTKAFYSSYYDAGTPFLLSTQFIRGQRFYIKIVAPKGDTLLAVGDSGGGTSMILPGTIDRLRLQNKVKGALYKGVMPVKYIPFSEVVNDHHIPPPVSLRNMIIRRFFSRVTEPVLFVPPLDGELKFMMESIRFDIFLGQNFFMGKAWTFDYIHQQIWVNTPLPASEAGKPNVQKIGFKKNGNNENVFGHGSMQIEVNGEVIDVLFDTGASMPLTEAGKKALHTNEKTIAGSFIARSIFDKWRKEHPDWKYYEKADRLGGGSDVIEVPVIKIGGYEVGPVLFAKRPDEAWSENMISTMDKVVKGAIGGSALQYFKVTVDYNSELIKFEK